MTVKNLELGLRQHADDALLVGNLASVLHRSKKHACSVGSYILSELVPSASDVEYLVGRMAKRSLSGTGDRGPLLTFRSDVAWN